MVAHHLILGRMYIHGDPQHDCFRCVALSSASSAVIDSYLSEGHENLFELKVTVHGPVGDWSIFRRSGASLALDRARKHGPIPFSSQAVNGYELKNARRVLIEGNVFENNWVHAQNGTGREERGQVGNSPRSIDRG